MLGADGSLTVTLPRLGLALVALVAISCKDPPARAPDVTGGAPVAATPPPAPPPPVELAGCRETLRTPLTCRVSPQGAKLRLFVAGSARPEIEVDADAPISVEAEPYAGGGWQATVVVDGGARGLTVAVPGATVWRLAIEVMPTDARLDRLLQDISDADDADDYRALIARADALLPGLPDVAGVDVLRARMLLRHQLGEITAALEDGEAALDLALRTGRVGAAIDIAQVLAFDRGQQGDEATARWLVDLQGMVLSLDVDGARRAGWHYYRGILAQRAGDLRGALVEFEAAQRIAGRLGFHDQELSAAAQRGILLGALGRHEEQAALVARVLAIVEGRRKPRCSDALELDNAAWGLMANPGVEPPPNEVMRLFERARTMVAPGAACDVEGTPGLQSVREDLKLGAALAALGQGELQRARKGLAAVEPDRLFPGMATWLTYARGLLALREGRGADALKAAQTAAREVVEAGVANPDPRMPWRLALLRGHAHARQGERKAAISAFEEADEMIDGLIATVGLDQGREGLAEGSHQGAAEAIELLVAAGEIDRAAGLARHSRARTFRPIGRDARLAALSPAERTRFSAELAAYREASRRVAEELDDAWRLDQRSRDAVLRAHAELRVGMRDHLQAAYRLLEQPAAPVEPVYASPASGELWLLWHPRASGWAAFAITAEGITHASVDVPPPGASDEAHAAALLGPFSAKIDAARTVHLLPMGELLELDFAALPFHGDALGAARSLAWKLDLPPSEVETPAGRRALVVGDPATRLSGLGRLPEAAAEARSVAATLRDRGWAVALLLGESASASSVAAEITAVDLLHWAGHGRRGDDGWDSRLPLAGEAAFDVRDVLALPSVPRWVVLTGCDTGKTSSTQGAGGMHLAGAFVVAGADLVVAAGSEVEDSLARELGEEIYAVDGSLHAGPERVRRAALALRARGHRDWTAFRAWVP